MKLKRMAEDLSKFQAVDSLALEDALGILQNVSKDIKKETGRAVEACEIRDPDALLTLLIWMGKLYLRVYDTQREHLDGARRLEEYKTLAAQLEDRIAQNEISVQQVMSASSQVKALEAECSELEGRRQTYERLLAQKKSLEERLDKWRTVAMDFPKLKESIAVTAGTVEELEKRLGAYQQKKDALSDQEAKLTQELARLEQTVKESDDEIASLTARKEKLESQAAVQRRFLGQTGGEVAKLEQTYQQVQEASDAAQEKKSALDTAVTVLQGELEELCKRAEELSRNKRALEESKAKSLSDITAYEGVIQQLQEVLPEAARQIEILSAKKEKLDAQAKEQDAKLSELKRDVEFLSGSELPTRRSKVAALTLQKNELREEQELLLQEIEKYDEELKILEEKTGKIEQKKRKKEEELLSVTEDLNAHYGQISDMDESIHSLREQISELEQQLAGKSEEGLAKKLEARMLVLREHKAKCTQLETNIEETQSQVERWEKETEKKRKELEDQKSRAKSVETELERVQSGLEELARRKEELMDMEKRLNVLKQIHQALIKHAAKLSELAPVQSYTAEESVDKLLQSADGILSNIHQILAKYIREANHNVEAIK